MEFMLNLSEDEEVACAVRGHAEILAEEAEKQEFTKQHVSRTLSKLKPPLLYLAQIQISENITSTGKR